MNTFAAKLKDEILRGLPGTNVQWQMSSSDRNLMNFPLFPGEDARVAAVLILLYPENGSIHTIFMQRPEYDGIHGGQISFPGGKRNLKMTALFRLLYAKHGKKQEPIQRK